MKVICPHCNYRDDTIDKYPPDCPNCDTRLYEEQIDVHCPHCKAKQISKAHTYLGKKDISKKYNCDKCWKQFIVYREYNTIKVK